MSNRVDDNYLKKELYELIKTDESIFDFIQESSLDGLWYWDLENPENEWMNPKFWTVLGYNPAEMPHKSGAWQKIINQDDLNKAIENFTKHCENANHPYDHIARYTHKNGSTVWIRCRGIAIRDKDGKPIRMLGAHHNITDSMVSMELNQAMAEMLDTAPNSITVHDTEGNWLYANQKTFEIHGYKPSEFFATNLHKIDVPASEALIAERIELIEKNDYASFEVEHYRKDGSTFPLEVYAKKVMWQGKPALLSIATEITERKKAEQVLKENEEKYRGLIETTNTGFVIIDSMGRVLDANDEYVRLTGNKKLQQILGRSVIEWTAEHNRDKNYEAVKQCFENGLIRNLEIDYVNENGYFTPVEINATLVKTENNIFVLSVCRDITQRKQNERELIKAKEKAEESQKKFKSIADTSPLAIYISKGIGQIAEYINPTFYKLFGYTYHEVSEVALWWPLAYPDVEYRKKISEEWNSKAEKAIENKTDIEPMETVVTCKNGSKKNILWGFVSTGDENWAFGMDLTAYRNAEKELIKSKEKAEESDRLKTAFLQNMSHEIRTPMNAIMGFSSLMPKNFNNREKLENFSKIIELRCNDLLDMINDILDISKIESGLSSISIEHCNINELFDELSLFFTDYKERIDKQNIDLFFHPASENSLLTIKTDKLKLKQVIINLVSNALKFTETGTIECGYKRENTKLQFYVRDTGIGIPADKHDFIFERFTQVKHPSLQNIGGTGLGLPIVKGLVKLLGGDVWLESECNKGTTFYFTIDYIKADSINTNNLAIESKKELITDKTILIVEDDFYNADYLKEVLSNISSNIITVANGLSAVKIVQEQKIDLILMDIRLPDITGYEATRLILQHNPDIKIIAQTAYAANIEHRKAIETGCVDYISKPTKQEQLLKMITKYLK